MNDGANSDGTPKPEALGSPLSLRLARERARLGQQPGAEPPPVAPAGIRPPLTPQRLPLLEVPNDDERTAVGPTREPTSRVPVEPTIRVYKRRRRTKAKAAATESTPSGERQRVRPETRAQMLERLTNPLISLHEASVLLRVCAATVRRYSDSGLLKSVRTEGGQRRFHLKDVLALMRQLEAKGK